MATIMAAPPAESKSLKHGGRVRIVGATGVCLAVVLLSHWWPFEQGRVIQDLQEASDSQVQVRSFQKTYFPHPGCVLEGVVFTRGTASMRPLISIERLTITGSYLGILARHLSRINADGMHVFIPKSDNGPSFHTKRSSISIDEIVADGAILEFEREGEKEPLRFDIREIKLRDVGWSGPLTYRLKMHNPDPPAEIAATGKFGVWNESETAMTPVSGEYKLENADLSVYHGISGMLSSTGKFEGKLGHIDVTGKTNTPDFEVTMSRHTVPLTTEFTASVNGTNGDTVLKRVEAHFRKTTIVADGSIAGSDRGKGKTALINLSAKAGRIEDILRLFVKSERSPMSGTVTLHAKAELPPGHRRFLEKIVLRGGFGIGGGEFTKPSTQESVNKLSAGAQGEEHPSDPETVLTNLTGKVVMENGVARFDDLSFGVPGAASRMRGTYGLLDHKIDMRGQLQVDSKISNTTSGVKSLLLKVMDPFFKKRKKGELLPVRISGTYENPSFGLDLKDKKAQEVDPPSGKLKAQK